MSVSNQLIQFPISSSLPPVSPASLLALLESWEDLRTPEALSFLKWLGVLPGWGTELSGRFLTRPVGSPRIERGYSLSDILEENVDEKYFLSEKMRDYIQKHLDRIQSPTALIQT